MCDAFYDFDSDKLELSFDGDLLTDLDGNLLIRLDDKAAVDLESGDLHVIAPLDAPGGTADDTDLSDPFSFDFEDD